MAEDDKLRALIKLIPPATALKEQLEQSIPLETWSGTGDAAIKSVEGLADALLEITKDSYVANLPKEVKEDATDKEKVSFALLIASQLCGFLEGQTGLTNLSGGGRNAMHSHNISTGTEVTIRDIHPSDPEQIEKMLDLTHKALGAKKKD